MKEKILATITVSVLNGTIKEDYLFSSTVFYYLVGRFPDASILDCTEAIGAVRSEYLNDMKFKKGE